MGRLDCHRRSYGRQTLVEPHEKSHPLVTIILTHYTSGIITCVPVHVVEESPILLKRKKGG